MRNQMRWILAILIFTIVSFVYVNTSLMPIKSDSRSDQESLDFVESLKSGKRSPIVHEQQHVKAENVVYSGGISDHSKKIADKILPAVNPAVVKSDADENVANSVKEQKQTKEENVLLDSGVSDDSSLKPDTILSETDEVDQHEDKEGNAITDDSADAGVAKLIRETARKTSLNNNECDNYVSEAMLDSWKKSRKEICKNGNQAVYSYVLDIMEYSPTINVYENGYVNTQNQYEIQPNCKVPQDISPNTWDEAYILFRMKRFDEQNPYEAHHSYINTYLSFRMLGYDEALTNLNAKVVMTDGKFQAPYDKEVWTTIFRHEPVYSDTKNGQSIERIDNMVEASSAGTSILVSSRGPMLRGRGQDHHCKSVLVKEFAAFIRHRTIGSALIPVPRKNKKIVVSSRRPYTRYRDGKPFDYRPKRHIENENDLVEALRKAYPSVEVVVVNFGLITFKESVVVAADCDVLVGVHGAGLIHTLYMPDSTKLIEIFGCDRSNSNRHYHNVASLVGVSYESITARNCQNALLSLDQNQIEQVVKLANF